MKQTLRKWKKSPYRTVKAGLLLLLFIPVMAYSQTKQITGTVTSAEDNSTLPGVTVKVKGTTQGTITDVNGKYSIKAKASDTLVFSFIGMQSVEKHVGNKVSINAELLQEASLLEEVVVVGYGTESKKLLTSSVSEVSADDLEYMPTTSVEEALQGKSAGVQINTNSGTPGGGLSVRIRGISSISAGNDPLYVVDGIPIISDNYSQISFAGQDISAVSDLSPSDIESISILKDASAAAIYGARATNGVVLITTKKGKAQKTRLNIKASTGMEQLWREPDLLNADEYIAYQREIDPKYSPPYENTNTDWLDKVTQTGLVQNYEVSASGGNKKTTYYLSGNYHNRKGVVKSTNYERLSGRMNLDHYANERLHFGAKVMISGSENNRVEGDQSLHAPYAMAISLPPVYPVYNEEGDYDQSGPYANPVAIVKEAINVANSFRNLSNIFADYKIMEGLMFKTKLGVDYYNLQEHSFDPPTTRQGAQTNGMGIEASSKSARITSNNFLTYDNSINKTHNFNILGGYSFERNNYTDAYTQGSNFPYEDFQNLESAATIIDAYVSSASTATNSVFGRLKYNYKYKYILNVNARYDGSSRFGENNRYGFFPGISGAWRITEEPFMDNLTFLSELKLKGGFGITGNDGIPNFRHMFLYGAGNYGNVAGLAPRWLGNPDLKWETTYQTDMGLTAGFLKNRLTLNVSYYNKNTVDLLFSRPMQPSSGYTTYTENIGEMTNQGVEFAVDAEIIKTKDMGWSSSFNISTNKNEVTKLYDGEPLENIGRAEQRIAEGEEFSHFYGYKSLGVDPSTGFIVFDDINGDGEITTADKTIIGSPHPDFIGGFSNKFRYQNLVLNLFFQYSYGNDIFNGTRIYTESLGGFADNQTKEVLDRWQKPGDITDIPKATSSAGPSGLFNYEESSRFVEDGSYIRLKSVSLSYNLGKDFLQKSMFSKLKFFVSANNLLTFTRYEGSDPEVNYAGNDPLIMGVDFFTYPLTTTYTFGVKIGI